MSHRAPATGRIAATPPFFVSVPSLGYRKPTKGREKFMTLESVNGVLRGNNLNNRKEI